MKKVSSLSTLDMRGFFLGIRPPYLLSMDAANVNGFAWAVNHLHTHTRLYMIILMSGNFEESKQNNNENPDS